MGLLFRSDKKSGRAASAVPHSDLPRFVQNIFLKRRIDSRAEALDLSASRDLSAAQLATLLALLPNLRTLNLSGMNLRALPKIVYELKGLRELDLSHNPLQQLPALLGQLGDLGYLNVAHTALLRLPSEIGALQNLHVLDASHNCLTELPGEIGYLADLRTLQLGYNALTELPSSLGLCKHLRQLLLEHNALRGLPAQLGKLGNLRILNAGHNQISALPAELCRCERLSQLNMNGNPLYALPPALVALAPAWGLKLLEVQPREPLNEHTQPDFRITPAAPPGDAPPIPAASNKPSEPSGHDVLTIALHLNETPTRVVGLPQSLRPKAPK